MTSQHTYIKYQQGKSKKLFLILISIFFICGIINVADFSVIAGLNLDSNINLNENLDNPLPQNTGKKNISHTNIDKLSYTQKHKTIDLSHFFSNNRQFEVKTGSHSKSMMETGVEDLFIDNP
ncbi:MAG: hypothetical protein U9Q34_00450, partial [Elusimicrobiota bacterium]|nr:hypothetical protein [Elusimicrobiota bacterium]